MLKGGTAINLTIFNLPRLSVDIDLEFHSYEPRALVLEERRITKKILMDHVGAMPIKKASFSKSERVAFEVCFTDIVLGLVSFLKAKEILRETALLIDIIQGCNMLSQLFGIGRHCMSEYIYCCGRF